MGTRTIEVGVLAAVLWVGTVHAGHGGQISVQGTSSTCCIGEGTNLAAMTGYWGQTFVALGKRIQRFEFYALDNYGDSYPGTFNFRVLLVDGAVNGPGSRRVMFESDTVLLPFVQNGGRFSTISVDMNCAKLEEGQTYTWVIDAYSTRDGVLDVGQIFTTTPGSAGYADGQLLALFATGNGRDADLAAQWWASGFDVAFSMAFTKHAEFPSPGVNVDENSTLIVHGNCPGRGNQW